MSTSSNHKVLVFTKGGGRLANQMINYLHLCAYYLENRERMSLLMLSFQPYRHFFQSMPAFCLHGKKRFWSIVIGSLCHKLHFIKRGVHQLYIIWLHRIVSRLPFVTFHEFGNMDSDGKVDISKKQIGFDTPHTYTFLSGWPMRCDGLIQKHEKELRDLFQFHDDYFANPQALVKRIRDDYDYVVGIQVRQTDYKKYRNGEYYYDAEAYRDIGLQCLEHFSSYGRVAVVFCSDTKQAEEVFNHPDFSFGPGEPNGDGHYFEDFVFLTLCDVIISPPSTFSAMAGFLGSIPWIPVMHSQQKIAESQVLENPLYDIDNIPELQETVI